MARRRIRDTKADRITKHLCSHLRNRKALFVLPNFYIGNWECDVFTLNCNGMQTEYEIKTSRQDYFNDFSKGLEIFIWKTKERKQGIPKHELIQRGERTNYFYFVCPEGLIHPDEVPEYAGLIYANVSAKSPTIFKTIIQAEMLHKNRVPMHKTSLIFTIAQKTYYRFINQRGF